MATDILGLSELAESQAGKYLTHNEALRQLEAILVRVLSRDNSGPPASPSAGDVYIVDVASGDWSTATVDDIAHYYSSAWHFYTPIEGLSVWCVADNLRVYYDGTDWAAYTPTASLPDHISGKTIDFDSEYDNGTISANTTIDWNNGNNQVVTLGASVTLTWSNMGVGHKQLRVLQDATGSRVPTLPSGKWAGGSAGTFSTAGDAEDILSIYYNGTSYYYQLTKGWA